ncbi:MAG TPA: TonB-dependent receptor [Candidatus Elarobacter sp.]|jgi:hypothetical protein|nr:TonB-dependent receptor [Candidatus Elarobacter sp.]
MLLQGTWALAGTTGSITGALTDATSGKAVADASVTAASPSQSQTVKTDQAGRYNFVSLAPDTYTVTFTKQGYQTQTQAGVTVQADQSVTVNSTTSSAALTQIGRVATRASNSLIRPGLTASEYSVTPSQQQAVAALGGGTNLNSAYSAIASVPGVVVPLGNAGWGQSIFIRGGDYTQTGNEVDGIPINRSFDQYASGALSSLGNQEVQIYTGNAPADAQAIGLAGFINQVIRTGTYPGNISAAIGVGTPAIYNHANFEVAGATPNRLFTYYAGTGGYSQQFRLLDQFNGQGYLQRTGLGSLYNYVATGCGTPGAPGAPYTYAGTPHPSAGCYNNASPFLGGLPLGPNGYAVGDLDWAGVQYLNDRETVANFHLGIKHPHDGNKDDVQLLYDYGNIKAYPNSSQFSWGPQLSDVVNGTVGSIGNVAGCPAPIGVSTTCAGPLNSIPFRDQNQYMGPRNAPITPATAGNVINYAYPASPSGRPLGASAPFARQDGETNAFAIVKAQYQHNISDKGYIRLYGYTLYSDRLDNGIVGLYQTFVGAYSPDYQISSHSRGFVLNGGYQLSAEHLLNINAGYVTANTTRYRNDVAAGNGETQVGYLLNSANPTQGCYSFTGTLTTCTAANRAGLVLPPVNAPPGPLVPRGASPAVGTETALTCGTGPCQYYAINDGRLAAKNTVRPKFFNAAIGDTWKPNAKLSIDASLRVDTFSYDLQDTSTLGNILMTNNYNNTHCLSGFNIVTRALNAPCPAGSAPTTLNPSSPALTYADILQPRVGATYTLNAYNVLRASYGRFVQAPETSSVQATNVQAGTPDANFYRNFGFNSFRRAIIPEVSFNTDFSWEHQVKGTDISSRITPFYRKTQNEFATVLVDQKTNFVAFVNGQNRTASGFELAVNKGDFARDGIAGQLSYTYTYASNHYKVFPNGGSFVNGINAAIGNYNQYTSFCGAHPADARCTAATAPVTAAPCYGTVLGATPALNQPGTPDPTCSLPFTVANPYYNKAPGSLFDPNAAYFPYNQQPGFATGTSTSYLIPHVVALVAQYKHGPLKITPSLQFQAGSRYGSPLSVGGIAPNTCAPLAGSAAASDPRYAGTGATAGGAYDAASCGGIVNIPNPTTGKFDGIGQFVQPNLINMNLQVSYDINRRFTLQVTAANIYSNCWGGSNVPWAVGGRVGCSYSAGLGAGNFYNPGDAIQPGFKYPYLPVFGASLQSLASQAASPPAVFFELKINHL